MKTINLKLDRMPLPPALVVAVIILVAAAGMSAVNRLSAPTIAAVPTPALIIIATPVPTPAAVVQVIVPRFVVCYDQPVNGAVLGPIPAPDPSTIVARYGVNWVMTPWNGGYCWLRARDVGLPDVADLEPPPQPQVIYVASQPAPAVATPTPEPVYQTTYEPPPAAPVVRAEDFKEPDKAATCAFVGCLR
jgi:hypothetical protein